MKVLFNPIQQNYNNKQHKTPSFKALSKNELCGLERFFVEKYDVPVQLLKDRRELAEFWPVFAKKMGITRQNAVQMLKNEVFPAGIEKYSIPDILNFAGMYCKKDSDGMYTLSNYYQPITSVKMEDLIHDETKLLKRVKEIQNAGEFSTSTVESLGNIKKIGGFVGLQFSKVKDLGKLEEIGSHLLMYYSDIKDLGNLRKIGGSACLNHTKLTSLGKLEEIGGNATFCKSDIKNLGSLKRIGGVADFRDSKVESLGQLEEIGGDAMFSYHSKLKDMGELKRIGGDADFTGIKNLKSLKNLKEIGRDGIFRWTNIKDLGKLETIGGNADFRNSSVANFDNLKRIGGDLYTCVSKLKDLKCIFVNGSMFLDPIKIPDFALMKDKLSYYSGYSYWEQNLNEQMKAAKERLSF